jgi:hypothetical protein
MGVFTNPPRATPPPSRDPRANTPGNRARLRSVRLGPSGGSSSSASSTNPRLTDPDLVPARPLPYTAHRSLTAAAKTIDLSDPAQAQALAKRRASGADAWQQEAWEYFDLIGEVKYAFSLVANIISRIRLYAAEIDNVGDPPTPAGGDSPGGGAAIAAIARLDSAFGGQPGLLRDAALNLCVTGECYLVQIPATAPHLLGTPYQPESWDIRSTDELEVLNDGTARLITRRDAGNDAAFRKPLPKNAFTARIWRPHPRFSDESDSSMRGLLDACAELLLLNKTFRATARSRLNSGMLILPDGLSAAASPDPEAGDPSTDDAADTDSDDFEESLIESAIAPIQDEESASAVVPLIVRGPADLVDKIRLVQFERSFDPALATRCDKVMDRILAGIDVPKEAVAGYSQVRYSNAIVIDESLFRSHIEPLALLLCDALTVVYLRPALRAAGVAESELDRYVVWYDPSEVTTRPNKSDDADTGYDKGLLSGAAWRRAHGFSDDDMPDSTELALRQLMEKGAVTPELTEALLAVFAPDVMAKVREASQAASPAPLPPDVVSALGGAPGGAPGAAPDSAGPGSPAGVGGDSPSVNDAPPAGPGSARREAPNPSSLTPPTPPGADGQPKVFKPEDLV